VDNQASLELPQLKADADASSPPLPLLSVKSSGSEDLGASPLTLIPSAKLKRLGRLGSGSFGEVFKAKYSDAIVAVKQSGVVCLDRASIERERRLLGSIPPHPNVVRVLGVCEDSVDNHLLIVMEYCAGGSLLSYLTLLPKVCRPDVQVLLFPIRVYLCSVILQQPYSAQLAVNILIQCATGIAHLHGCGVIHRDIRCSNMLVASKDPLRVVVADFGLSHIIRGCDGLSTSATMLGPIGAIFPSSFCLSRTPLRPSVSFTRFPHVSAAWRAPETFEDGDLQVVSTKTDVYMFGCFILEVLTVASPWWWIRKSESLLRVRLRSPINPLDDAVTGGKFHCVVRSDSSDGSAGVVHALIGLIRRCLEHDPARRPTIASIIHTLNVIAGRDVDGEVGDCCMSASCMR
jgi:serine/threonine protein kinase